MSERKFTEEEVAAIFERATRHRATETRLTSGAGMTLAQIQEIAREAGISAESVGEAAQVVSTSGQPLQRTVLGLPLAVGRTIELGRRLTDDEWERLVVDLRETFGARGSVRLDGQSLRQWTNGNLQALLEPTPSGHRVRLRTMRGASVRMMTAGALALAMAGVTWATVTTANVSAAGFIAAAGAAMLAAGALVLPGWARTRRKQMEEIAERLALAGRSPAAEEPADR